MENNVDYFQNTNPEHQPSEVEIAPPEPEVDPTNDEEFPKKIMGDLGLQIKGTGVHRWRIDNYSHLAEKQYSPEFELGGYKWRILVFPKGNNKSESLSVFLDSPEAKAAPSGWHVCVQFSLVICNAFDERIYLSNTANHRFVAEESDWGFNKTVDLSKLVTPWEDKSRPLLENDCIMIKAYLRIMEDSTGVLWHTFENYDSKKETGYVGLKNQGATCYMNSLLQSLYCTNYFRKATYQIPTLKDDPSKSVALALQRVFYNLQTSDSPPGTTELTKSFGWDSIDSFMQHDVQEFNRVLQDNLEGKMKGTAADGSISKLFVGKMKSYIKCVNVPYESSRVENYYDIQLNVKGCKTLRDSFVDYVAEETLEGDNKYMAEGHGLQDAKKGVIFDSIPPVLHLQLKRFEYDFQRDCMVKINDRYEFPHEIDLSQFLSGDADKSCPYNYILHGVLVHSGDVSGGHYCAFIKPDKNGKWLKFDDDRVIPVTEKEVFDDNFGGDIYPAMKQRPGMRTMKRFTNAYMLVYIRESELENVLCPVNEDDVPEHIRREIKEKKEADEIRRKELQDQHLFLTIKVVSDEQIRNHQGFDLANFDDPTYETTKLSSYRVKKAETLKEFKEKLAQDFNCPVEQIRLRALSGRHNKTLRPDLPFSEVDYSCSIDNIYKRFFTVFNEGRIYLEISNEKFNGMWFPTDNNSYVLLHIKFFDYKNTTLETLGHLLVSKQQKIQEIHERLISMKSLDSDVNIRVYEEIKPHYVEEVKPNMSIESAELGNGDILCFQIEPSSEELEAGNANSILYALQYYEYLTSRIIVLFKPKNKPANLEFALELSKQYSYDKVAEKVGTELEIDPYKLRFTSSVPPGFSPRTIIKRAPGTTLQDMLYGGYSTPQSQILYYEILEHSILELETKRFLKVTFTGLNNSEEEHIELLLPKDGLIKDILVELKSKVKLTENGSGVIRLLEVMNHRIYRTCKEDDSLSDIKEYLTLLAEEVPIEEVELSPQEKTISCFHFNKDPTHPHGQPFLFVVKEGEIFRETYQRLQKRSGLLEKEFSRTKIAVISSSLNKIKIMLDEEGMLSDEIRDTTDCIGIDHPDRALKSGRYGSMEKSIKIFN